MSGYLRGPSNGCGRISATPACNPFFTGREAILEELGQPQAISRLRGNGKTQAPLEYAYRHRDDYPVVLWVLADSRETLVSGFAGLARVLNLPEKDAYKD